MSSKRESGGQSAEPDGRAARPAYSIRNIRSGIMEPRFGKLKENRLVCEPFAVRVGWKTFGSIDVSMCAMEGL